MIGTTILHYKILEKLGEGGMGIVYKAEDTKLRRTVALKFLPPDLTRDEQAKERFLYEAQAASALDHPNICTVYEIGETLDRELFIAMPHYEGETLKKRIARGPLPLDDALDFARQVASGLAKAHAQGITHRDIKPGNIIVTTDGVAKILDFGLAKLAGRTRVTVTGATVGTPLYMSPEQAMGSDVDHRSDIWSFGITLYEMLTSQPPFASDYEQAIIYGILNEEPEHATKLRPDLPMGVDVIIEKALEKSPEKRYENAEELIGDLENLKSEIQTGNAKRKTFHRRIPQRKLVYVYGGLMTFLVLLAIAASILMRSGVEKPIDSIAVLPLKNLSGDPEQEYFIDGVHEALITQLSKISALKIISRTSTVPYKNTDKPMPQVAHELGVDGIIEGSVQHFGNRVRITAQLIHGPTDRHLWAKDFDRHFGDILALQSELAQAIAKEIKVTITPQEASRIAAVQTVDPRAQEAYFKADFFLWKLTADGIPKAYDYLQEAIAADSSWASPYALLADWYVQTIYVGSPPSEVFPKARQAVTKALALDSTSAHAFFTLADISFFDMNWSSAERAYRRGLELNPGSASGHARYATLLSIFRRHEEALREARLALELDPIANITRGQLAMVLTNARKFDEAIEQSREALILDPAFEVGYLRLAWALQGADRSDEAVATMEKALHLFGDSQLPWKAFAAELYAHAGRTDSARRLLGELLKNAGEVYIPPGVVGSIYAGIGDMDEAIRWLWRAYEVRDFDLLYQLMTPQFDEVRNDPRILELFQRMNVPESVKQQLEASK